MPQKCIASSCIMDYVCRSLTHEFLNECSLSSLKCLLCFELTAEMTENYSLQTCFPSTQLTFSNQYALLQILHTVVPISSQKSCILNKTHLSLTESCLCAGPAGQINELSILSRKRLKPWALIKLAGCTNTRPVSLFPSSVGG